MKAESIEDIEVKYNESKNTIKIWPYMDDISQAVFPYTDKYLSKEPNMVVNLDFSNVKSVSSSGSAITLKKLLSISFLNQAIRPYKLIPPKNKYIESVLQNIGFFSILDNSFHFGKYFGDLFEEAVPICIQSGSKEVVEESNGIKKTIFPIIQLRYDSKNVRGAVDEFADYLDEHLLGRLDNNYHIKTDILFSVLIEIAKNSQDHTKNDAFFGFDLMENQDTGNGELLFSCSDLGNGIAQTVRKYLEDNPQKDLRADIWKHGSLTDFYKWAFTLGNTTSKNPTNKGIGMTMIIDGVRELNMDLSFFDARSMMQMPESLFYSPHALNHEELRKRAWNTGNKVGFYYFGRLTL